MTVEQHLSVKSLAELLDMGESTIWREMLSGRLRSVKIGGCRRIPVSAVEEWCGGAQGEILAFPGQEGSN